MKKLGWVVLVLVLIAAVAVTVLYAQGAGGGQRRPGGGPGGGPMELERMRMQLQVLGLNEQEMAAAEKTMQAKTTARQALQEELGKLRQVAENPSSTDPQLTEAINAYTKALAAYRTKVQNEDSALAKELSVRSRAKCLASGLLDNGLGMGGRVRMGGPGAGGMGGGGGRRGPVPPPR